MIVVLLLLSMNIMIFAKKLSGISYKKISLEPTLIPLSTTIQISSSLSSSLSKSNDINNNDDDDDNDNDNDDMKSAIEIRNTRLLSKFKIRPESASIILENPRMKNVDIEERILELHSTIGLTKPKLKVTLDNYPSLAVDMLSSPGNYQYLLLLFYDYYYILS